MVSVVPVLTDKGASLLLRAIGGETVTFTKFKAGSGELGTADAKALSDLIDAKLTFDVTGVDSSQSGVLGVSGTFDNENVETDIVWRETGLFAKGEDNVEILYAYANEGSEASTIRAYTGTIATLEKVTFLVAIGEAEHVNAAYTPNDLLVKGQYTGDGTHKKGINLGFKPSAVMITDEYGRTYDATAGVCGGLALALHGVRAVGASATYATTWGNSYTAIMIGEGEDFAGFWVNYQSGAVNTNGNGGVYHYVAYR